MQFGCAMFHQFFLYNEKKGFLKKKSAFFVAYMLSIIILRKKIGIEETGRSRHTYRKIGQENCISVFNQKQYKLQL